MKQAKSLGMLALIPLLFAASLLNPVEVLASPLSELKFFERICGASAVKVSGDDGSTGTGFFAKLPDSDSLIAFVSNKHVFGASKSLRVMVPLGDKDLNYTSTLEVTIPLYDSSGNKLFNVANSSLDIAAVVIPKTFGGGRFASLPLDLFADIGLLSTGMEVKFYGFPLGITADGIHPLIRKGVVAGVDTLKGIIYLDAQVFGGSSGSPVYLDPSSPANTEFLKKHNGAFLIGIITSSFQGKKRLLDERTGKVAMIQTENIGLGIVMSASRIEKLLRDLLHVQSDVESGN